MAIAGVAGDRSIVDTAYPGNLPGLPDVRSVPALPLVGFAPRPAEDDTDG